MAKIKLTVPVFIGGKPFAVDDVAEIDDYDARLLIGMGRAVLCVEPISELATDGETEDAGEDGGARKGRKKT